MRAPFVFIVMLGWIGCGGGGEELPPDAGPSASDADVPPRGTARFADATPRERDRALQAAAGGDAATTLAYARFGIPAPPCPSRDVIGGVIHLAGDCVAGDTSFSGAAAFENVFATDRVPYDPSSASRLTFASWADASPQRLLEIDGALVIEPGGSISAIDLRVALDGAGARARGSYRSDDGAVTPDPGTVVIVDGNGDAVVTGRWSLAEPPSGRIALRGVDVLALALDARDADGCIPYTIDDAPAGHLCPD